MYLVMPIAVCDYHFEGFQEFNWTYTSQPIGRSFHIFLSIRRPSVTVHLLASVYTGEQRPVGIRNARPC